MRFGLPALIAAGWLVVAAAAPAAAHPGGLDASGCHTNRKTGDYHCHGKARSSAKGPARAAPAPGGGVYFRNCAEARAAGYRRIRRGEPGYRPALDRDNDGLACE
ncbi:MAG: excalibur calcium-binding domain-containing protein [Gemmobacter sp.]